MDVLVDAAGLSILYQCRTLKLLFLYPKLSPMTNLRYRLMSNPTLLSFSWYRKINVLTFQYRLSPPKLDALLVCKNRYVEIEALKHLFLYEVMQMLRSSFLYFEDPASCRRASCWRWYLSKRSSPAACAWERGTLWTRDRLPQRSPNGRLEASITSLVSFRKFQ